MSGRKTTYTRIDVNELARLRREAERAASLSESNRALQRLGATTDALIQDQQNRLNHLNQTIQHLNQALAQRDAANSRERQLLRQQLQESIRQTNEALQETSARTQEQMDTLERSFQQELRQQRAETAQMIQTASQHMEQTLQRSVSHLEHQLGEVNHRVSQVEQAMEEQGRQVGVLFRSDTALLELAREYADTARVIQQEIAGQFRTELLLPGRLDALQSLVNQAEHEIADTETLPTNAPVARLTARQAAQAAMQLHEDMIKAEQAWQIAYQAARQAVNAAEAQGEASRQVKFPGEDAQVDVDQWSNGDLTALNGRVTGLRSQLDRAEALTLDQLEGIRQAGVQAAREMLESAEFAVVAFGASQDRADVAQDVADHMREALGLEIQADGYQNDDQRGAHRIHLKNPATGFEMVVVQYPESCADGSVCNRLESDILDYGTNNEAEGDQIARQALEALSGLGLSQGPVETVPGYEQRPSQRRERASQTAWQREASVIPAPIHTEPEQSTAQ